MSMVLLSAEFTANESTERNVLQLLNNFARRSLRSSWSNKMVRAHEWKWYVHVSGNGTCM